MDFKPFFDVFIKIHEYANKIICITYHRIKRDMSSLKNDTRLSGLGQTTVAI